MRPVKDDAGTTETAPAETLSPPLAISNPPTDKVVATLPAPLFTYPPLKVARLVTASELAVKAAASEPTPVIDKLETVVDPAFKDPMMDALPDTARDTIAPDPELTIPAKFCGTLKLLVCAKKALCMLSASCASRVYGVVNGRIV